MPLITRNSQNANVKLGTTAQLAAITFTDGDLASDTTLNKLKIFDGSTLQNVGATSFSSSAVVSQSTTIGNYTTPSSAVASSDLGSNVEYLVIGGGGGGSGKYGGGGGAGAYRTATGFTVATQTYTITVGAGGAGGVADNSGSNGGSSIFSTITSTGGGYGSRGAGGSTAGGSGGGGAVGANGGAAGTYGTAGGNGSTPSGGNYAGGGGGGASTAGANGPSNTVAGNGGNGTSSSITGTSITRAGGGGGSTWTGGTVGLGGTGGGGLGGISNTNENGTDGTVNTGSGGGSASYASGVGVNGGAGGSGLVIIRYLTAQMTATGGTITTDGSYTINTFTSSGDFVVTLNDASRVKDDNTATKWTSSSESNPNVYVDMGSALNLCAAAFYFNSTDTTNTEILIQSSADASTWTTKRTITTSNLTNGAYNYYRFNIAGGSRYIRFYGNSAGSTVLSIWEIKILKKTDAEIFNDLGILTITASDTALGPDGT